MQVLGREAGAQDLAPVSSAPPAEPRGVAAFGRLQPKDGVMRVAGPATVAVVARLDIDQGDLVRKGQVIALLDEAQIREAEVERARARVANSESEVARFRELHRGQVVSDSQRDALGTDPAARTDARVVEVEIRLDPEDAALAAALTHLQVEVSIEP